MGVRDIFSLTFDRFLILQEFSKHPAKPPELLRYDLIPIDFTNIHKEHSCVAATKMLKIVRGSLRASQVAEIHDFPHFCGLVWFWLFVTSTQSKGFIHT